MRSQVADKPLNPACPVIAIATAETFEPVNGYAAGSEQR